jgi:hypothetical protein
VLPSKLATVAPAAVLVVAAAANGPDAAAAPTTATGGRLLDVEWSEKIAGCCCGGTAAGALPGAWASARDMSGGDSVPCTALGVVWPVRSSPLNAPASGTAAPKLTGAVAVVAPCGRAIGAARGAVLVRAAAGAAHHVKRGGAAASVGDDMDVVWALFVACCPKKDWTTDGATSTPNETRRHARSVKWRVDQTASTVPTAWLWYIAHTVFRGPGVTVRIGGATW